MRKTFLFFFFFIPFLGFSAWQLPVTNYIPKEYGAGTQNWQIKQQKNGWIYSANNYGLLEFDGKWWSLYGIWNYTVIRSIDIGEDGTVYVGGANEFGKFFSNDLGGLDYTPLSLDIPDEYKNFGEVWNLHKLHDNLYIQTRNYFFIQSADGTLDVIDSKARIFCSAKIRDGIYVATADGIYLLTGNQLNALRGSELLSGFEIRSMQAYGTNGVLIGTDFNGLFLYDGDAIKPFITEADRFIRDNQLYSLAVGTKYIACGTVLNGLVITDLNGKVCRYVNTQNGLQNNTVLSMLFDRNNNLWLGLDQGIDRVVIDSSVDLLYSGLHSYGSGYASYIIDNTIYLGTNQGLYYGAYPFKADESDTHLDLIHGSLGQVWSLDFVDSTLFCCHNRGLFVVENRSIKPISTKEGFWQVRAFPKETHYALAGGYNGLYLLHKESGHYEILRKLKGYDETSRVFEFDEQGRLWIVSSRGVERLQFDAGKTTCSAELMQPVVAQNDYFGIDRVGNSVVISNSRYCRVVDANGQITEDTDFFKLLDGIRYYAFIRKDNGNNIWYLTNDVLNVRTYDFRMRCYSEHPVPVIEKPRFFVGGFAHINMIGSHEAIVGSVAGFALANLNNAYHTYRDTDNQVLIRQMMVTVPYDSVVYGQSYPVVETHISLPYHNNSVRFALGGAFCLDGTDEYSVRLLPNDVDFGTWSSSTTKEYISLPEGRYQFQVRMRTSSSELVKTTTINFTILPPWYRSWWAYIIWIALILCAAYMVYLYIIRKIEAGKRKLARQKDAEMKERERQFAEETHNREKEILQIKNERTEFELKNKSQELANVLLNHLNKNELVSDVKRDLKKISEDLQDKNNESATRRITVLQGKLTRSIEQEIDWKKFEENFDLVNDKFIKKLTATYPWLNKNERRLCVYIRMGLYTKEIAPLMNLSIRGVEMLRYRMRKKMELERNDGLEEFLQRLTSTDSLSDDTKATNDEEKANN